MSDKITTVQSFSGSDPVPMGVFYWKVYEQSHKGEPSTYIVTNGPRTGMSAVTYPGRWDTENAMAHVHTEYVTNGGTDDERHASRLV